MKGVKKYEYNKRYFVQRNIESRRNKSTRNDRLGALLFYISIIMMLTIIIGLYSALQNYGEGVYIDDAVVSDTNASMNDKTSPETGHTIFASTNDLYNGNPFDEEEIDLLALVTMAEAEGECELGQRLVIDVILNRLDNPMFTGETIHDVIYAKGQFSSMWNGRADRCYVKDDIRQLVIEEIAERTNRDVLYFRTRHYHSFGTPLFKVGNHYFSTSKRDSK